MKHFSSKIGSAELSTAEVGIVELNPLEVGSAELGSFEISSAAGYLTSIMALSID